MSRRTVSRKAAGLAAAGVAVLCTVGLAAIRNPEGNVLNIGGETQLFLDDFVIESMTGLRRTINQPARHPSNPVVRGEHPWEQGVLHPLAVARDPETAVFHLYYRATSAPPGQEARESLCYARSRDGVHWEKPGLRFVQLSDKEGGTPNNLIAGPGTPMAVFVRPEEPDPARRFLGLFSGSKPASVAAWYSPDGLRWEKASETGDLRASPRTPPNPGARYFYTGQCWAGRNAWGAGRRGVMRADSADLVNWGGNLTIFAAGPDDPENLEFYTMSVADMRTAHKYHGLHIGFLHYFHTDLQGKRNPGNNAAMSGPIDVYLAVSRDTVRWQRVDPATPFLPLGPQGAFDSGMVFLCSMVEYKDQLYFYYDGWDLDHGDLIGTPSKTGRAQIGLATLKRDRFVCLQPQGDQGTLTTRPLLIEGSRLFVNADARGGRLTVQALDAQASPIGPESKPITTDGLRHQVAWPRGNPLAARIGQAARLKFTLHGPARLYAFQLAGPEAR